MYNGYYYGFDMTYLVLVVPALLIALIAQIQVKSAFSRYAGVRCMSGLTGAQADSVAAETPQFETLRTHRPVYGGGGIRPDVRVEADTVGQTGYWLALMRHGVVNELVLRYLDRERPQLTARYPDFERFDAGFAVSPAMMSELAEMAAAQGIEPAGDEAAQSDGLLKLQIKALVAERLFPREGFYRVMNAADGSMFRRAVELLGAWSEQGKQILSK